MRESALLLRPSEECLFYPFPEFDRERFGFLLDRRIRILGPKEAAVTRRPHPGGSVPHVAGE